MKFSSSGFIKGLLVSLFVCVLLFVVLRSFGIFGGKEKEDGIQGLAKEALAALDAVKRRQPGDRRPASYDAVLAPVDRILRQIRDIQESETYDPVRDFEKIRTMVNPVLEITTLADRQAKTETGPLAKDFRFNDQKGEAIQYLASAMWERIQAQRIRNVRPLDEPQPLPEKELRELRQVLATGLDASQDNRTLWYIRGLVNRAEGLFGPAARDLERAISISPEFVAAWNTLGLVRISLKEFDRAEEAYERARALALEEARRMGQKPGAEYVSIVYNLATFHENLASFYNRENRITPTVESRRLLSKHAGEARKYLEEFLSLEPANSPDARAALAKLNGLPRM